MLYFWDDRLLKLLVMIVIASIILLVKSPKLFSITKILFFINVIFCLFTFFNFYHSKFEFSEDNNPQIAQLISQKDADKDIYIIMLDGFPDQEVLSKYFNYQSGFLKYLAQNGYKKGKSLSKYSSTFQSVPNIFSGVNFNNQPSFSTKDIDKMKTLLPGNFLQNFSFKYQYQLHFTSLLIDSSNPTTKLAFGRGTDFSLYGYSLIDRLFKLIPHYQDSYDLEFGELNNHNLILINQALDSKKKQLNFYHFLTFHTPYFFLNNKERVIKMAEDAGNIGLKAVELIHQKKPNAKIIIFSDHGERSPMIDKKDYLKGILYIKN